MGALTRLKEKLSPEDRIVVFSCNNCAKKCKDLGGRPGMKALSDKLEAHGFNVIHRELCGIACSLDMVRKRATDEATRGFFEQADVIIPLSCEDGEDAIHHVWPDKKVLKVTRTIGLGWASPKAGVRLVQPLAGIPLEMPSPEGITIDQAAEELGLPAGAF